MAEVELSLDLGKMKKFLIIGFLIIVLVLELNLTFNNPIAFGDEGFHVSSSKYIGTEIDYSISTPLFGSTINPERFNRPPLWNLMEASFYFLFGFSDMFIKFLVPFLSFMTGLAIYAFLRKLYSENVGIIGAAIAVTIPSFVTYSVLFYTVVPYVFFLSVAFLSLLTAIKTGEKKFWLLAGIFSGVSILANIAGLFMPILVLVMGLIHLAKHRNLSGFKAALKTYGLVILLTLLVILPWGVRNIGLYYVEGCGDPNLIFQGACREADTYQTVTSNQFVGRNVGGGTEDSVLNIGLANYIQFAYGFFSSNPLLNIIGLAFVPFSVLAGSVVLAKRRSMYDIAVIASLLIFFGLSFQFGGLFEGRSEDTARYFLSAVPVIGIAAASFWSEIRKDGRKFGNIIVIIILIAVMAASFFNFYSKLTQMEAVKDFVPSFFETCNWAKSNLPEDANLLSLHTYPTRYNCDRGAIWEMPDKADILLSNNLSLVKDRLEANGIDYIFVQKFAISTQAFGQNYPLSFVQFLETDNQTFRKLYENGPIFGTQDFVNCLNVGCDAGNAIYEVLE